MNQRTIQDITNFIFMKDTPQKSDVIFIPGTARTKISEKAAELYLAGFAPYILPSGMYSLNVGRFTKENIDNPCYNGDFATEFEYCKHILIKNGVPEDAILCCQAFHARRAYMSYTCHFPNAEILVIPSDTQGITAEGWSYSEKSYRKVMGEVAKCGKYFADYWKMPENNW